VTAFFSCDTFAVGAGGLHQSASPGIPAGDGYFARVSAGEDGSFVG
jgi:hypothetical protein